MTRSMATVIPIRGARSRKIDLALALAMLSKSAKAHERARQVKLASFARSVFRTINAYAGATFLGT